MLTEMQHNEQELEKLIEACRHQNRKAQHRLFKLFYGRLFAVCMRYAQNEEEAQDMVNEGFLKIFTHIEQYQSREDSSFFAWAKRVTIYAAIDYQRKYKTAVSTTSYDEVAMALPAEQHENEALARLSAQELINMIQQLPTMSKNVFNLYIFDNYSHAEIAQMLNIKEGTSHWHLNFARNKLKRMIHENNTRYDR